MERICKADGCNRTDIKAKGYCSMHWQRIKRNGSLTPKILKNGPRMEYPEEYKSWASMRDRCINPNHKAYAIYGGRGIKVCDRWLELPNGFVNFIEDMGRKPSYERTATGGKPLYSLDRIDPDGDYCPENCRWTTWLVQASNKRNSAEVPGVHQQNRVWIARHRTRSVNIHGSFPTEEMAVNAKKDWIEKYPL